jgi:FMN-dependent NADH-azoreductase
MANPGAIVAERDASTGLSFIDENWLGANWTPDEERNAAKKSLLALSDTLIEELEQADIIVLGVPMYNFAIPAALKAWIDLIARAKRTFRYTADGPEGLLKGKKAYVVMTSGGVPAESPVDFVTSYMRHVLGFVGITDVTFVNADRLIAQEEASLGAARQTIAAVAA